MDDVNDGEELNSFADEDEFVDFFRKNSDDGNEELLPESDDADEIRSSEDEDNLAPMHQQRRG